MPQSRAPWVRKFGNLSDLRNFGSDVSERPPARTDSGEGEWSPTETRRGGGECLLFSVGKRGFYKGSINSRISIKINICFLDVVSVGYWSSQIPAKRCPGLDS